MFKTIRVFSKLSVLVLVGTVMSALGGLSGTKKVSTESIRNALTIPKASADVPYSEGSYYGEGSYNSGGDGGGCGCGCCCNCGCGCGCSCC